MGERRDERERRERERERERERRERERECPHFVFPPKIGREKSLFSPPSQNNISEDESEKLIFVLPQLLLLVFRYKKSHF